MGTWTLTSVPVVQGLLGARAITTGTSCLTKGSRRRRFSSGFVSLPALFTGSVPWPCHWMGRSAGAGCQGGCLVKAPTVLAATKKTAKTKAKRRQKTGGPPKGPGGQPVSVDGHRASPSGLGDGHLGGVDGPPVAGGAVIGAEHGGAVAGGTSLTAGVPHPAEGVSHCAEGVSHPAEAGGPVKHVERADHQELLMLREKRRAALEVAAQVGSEPRSKAPEVKPAVNEAQRKAPASAGFGGASANRQGDGARPNGLRGGAHATGSRDRASGIDSRGGSPASGGGAVGFGSVRRDDRVPVQKQAELPLLALAREVVLGGGAGKGGAAMAAVPREEVLQQCTNVSLIMVLMAVGLRQASHWAYGAGLFPRDCAALMSYEWDVADVLPVLGLVAIVTASRYAALKVSDDFAESFESSNRLLLTPLPPHEVPLLAVLPGFSEELLFRGLLLPAISFDWVGAVASGVVFGLLHISGGRKPVYGIWASFGGILYGLAAVWTGNLWVPSVAHFVNNLMVAVTWKAVNPGTKQAKQ